MNEMSEYLPIPRPMEVPPEQDGKWFYDHIVSMLLPDIIRMQSTGIPIDLSKVRVLEDTVEDVLANVQHTMLQNPLMQKFRQQQSALSQAVKCTSIQQKAKTVEDFIPKECNPSNKIHRSYIVNQRLKDTDHMDYYQPEWTLKDLKLLLKVHKDPVLSILLEEPEHGCLNDLKYKAMLKLASDKYDIYYKSKIEPRLTKAMTEEAEEFNCGSAKQKTEFFSSLGIQSEATTGKGNPCWNRDELEKLDKLLDTLIEQGEQNGTNGRESV